MLDDPAVAEALANSHLRDLPADVTATLLESATRIHALAGSTVREFGEPGPYLELLVDGLLRVFVRAPDGRSLTVRYLRPGELSGVVSLFTPNYSFAATLQAVVDSDLIGFRADVVIRLAERRHPRGAEGHRRAERACRRLRRGDPGKRLLDRPATRRAAHPRPRIRAAAERPARCPGEPAGSRRRRRIGPRGRRPGAPRSPGRRCHPNGPGRDRGPHPGRPHR